MIAAMKHFLCLLAALFSGLAALLPLPAVPARADGAEQYAVAAREDVWFYAAENEESGLFLLPYTYYVVQYLDDVAPYRAITGFCKTDALTFVDFVPARPYLRREISVTYSVAGEGRMGGGAFDKIEKRFVYYGTSFSGTARFFYVYADGVFDYVPATQDILFELNTDYLKPVSGTQEPSEGAPSSAPSPVQIAVICAAVFALVAIAVFVLRGKRPKSSAAEEF